MACLLGIQNEIQAVCFTFNCLFIHLNMKSLSEIVPRLLVIQIQIQSVCHARGSSVELSLTEAKMLSHLGEKASSCTMRNF
jgi:hypothetical protein